jgi:hypothetical protein
MKREMRVFPARLALCLALALPAAAKNGSEPLNHYSLSALQDSAVGAKLMGRFKAKGQPVFLIHDPSLGLAQGDIMRFQDKAVLVDADVWQTLQDEGALGRLKASPVMRVQAKASVPAWDTRARLVGGEREKKAYKFGAELLKILEETFGGIPSREQMALVFDGNSMVLMAPDEFLDGLKYAAVRRVAPGGRPQFLTPAPGPIFAGQPFVWQAWAADPSEPAGALRYSLTGELPKGLAWDAAAHTLQGTPAEPGQWRLSAEARNAAGAFDTLSLVLSVRANAPPRLAWSPKPVAIAGQEWTFTAAAVDPDHEGGQVRVIPGPLPAGMEFDPARGLFHWTPGDSLAGKSFDLAVGLQDPLGGRSDTGFSLRVIPASDMLWSEGIRPALPWDTLQQGKTYTWEAGASAVAWAQQGISLIEVNGSDSTAFHEGALAIVPRQAGTHVLTFVFDMLGKRVETRVLLPVKPDLPPRFGSEVGVWRLRAGQSASYRPVAVDGEGDAVTLSSDSRDGRLYWDDGRLVLDSEFPGLYAARVSARDPRGNASDQWVAFKVEPAERPVAWFLENRREAGLSVWAATADFGTGRLGFFTPALDRIGVTGPSGARAWPFLTIGGNLLGREAEKMGRRLWADAGITFRMPDPKVATGGLMGRLLGEWTFPGQALGRIEFEMEGHVNQAVVVADTSKLQVIYGDAILKLADDFNELVRGVIREATARDNMVLYTRLEAWSRLGAGFWAGPGIWREEIPNANRFRQMFGGGLRFQARLDEAMAMNSLRAGWGSGVGWSVYWTGRISINSPF